MSSAPQTSIDTPRAGLPGAPCDDHAARHNRNATYLNEEASAGIPFGCVVKLGSAERKAKLPSAKTDKLVGIALYSPGYNRVTQLDDDGIQPGTYFAATEVGGLWIAPEEDIAVGDQVHVRVTAFSGKTPGQIGKTDDGVRTINITPFAQWGTAGGPTSGQPAKLRFDFTNAALAVTDS